MKKVYKHAASLLGLAFVLIANLIVAAGAAELNSDDITMGMLESEMKDYLYAEHPEVEVGTTAYVEYLTSVLIEGSDEALAAKENYGDIRTYASEYLSIVDEKQALTTDKETVLNLTDEEKNITISDIKQKALRQEQADAALEEEYSDMPVAYSSYDRYAAADYAIEYAKDRNLLYPVYTSDCTNFVSQALAAGGIPMDEPSGIPHGTNSTTDYWYSNHRYVTIGGSGNWEFDVTTSWIRVRDLYSYARKNGARTYTYDTLDELQDNAKIGDVVQLKNEDGTWYHSIIITSGSKGNYKYCGHTSDRKNKSLSSLVDQNAYRIIRF